MAKSGIKNNKPIRSSDIPVNERINRYKSAVKSIKSSPDKTRQYLESTGIYTKTGQLTKAYK